MSWRNRAVRRAFRLFRITYAAAHCGIQLTDTMANTSRPTKQERREAYESYDALAGVLRGLRTRSAEVEFYEGGGRVTIPRPALELFAEVLKRLSEGKSVTIVATDSEVTTQVAADLIGCSRPHLVKLLEAGEIAFTTVGRHRRVRYDDLLRYRADRKAKQRALLAEVMRADEEAGLYDSE